MATHIIRDRRGGNEPEPSEPSPDASVERLRHELAQAKHDYLRVLADVDNTKKRLQREKEEFSKYAAEAVLRDLLPIVDSLDQALVAVDPSARPSIDSPRAEHGPRCEAGLARDSAPAGLRQQPDPQAVIKGVHLIYRQLLELLERAGVKRIPTVGERFDPHYHEAVERVEASDGQADGVIVEAVRVGYTMHGRVIRPAMVKIAKQQTSDLRPQTSGNEESKHTDV